MKRSESFPYTYSANQSVGNKVYDRRYERRQKACREKAEEDRTQVALRFLCKILWVPVAVDLRLLVCFLKTSRCCAWRRPYLLSALLCGKLQRTAVWTSCVAKVSSYMVGPEFRAVITLLWRARFGVTQGPHYGLFGSERKGIRWV